MRCADELELGRCLQRNFLRYWQLRRCVDELAVSELATRRRMHDHTVRGPAGARIDLPLLGCRTHEHDPGGGARATHRFPARTDGRRAAGDLNTDQGIRVQLVVRW